MTTFGDGRPVPPEMPRSAIELERAGRYIASCVRHGLPDSHRISVEADVSALLLRLVFHYGNDKVSDAGTVEIDLKLAHPINNHRWLDSLAENVLERVASNESDLIIPHHFDYIRYCDEEGVTLFEEGTVSTRMANRLIAKKKDHAS